MKIKNLVYKDDSNIKRLILSDITNIEYKDLVLNYDKNIGLLKYFKYKNYLKRYKKGEPIQYILKKTCFYGYDFIVNKNVLIPRFETEVLIEKVLKEIQNDNIKILDIGTGSGIIAITLKKNLSNSEVYATDISKKAIKVAEKNAKLNNVDINFINTNITDGIEKKFDLIISNPPYIKENGEVEDIVKNNEPSIALFAKDNGLYFYEEIIKRSKKLLNKKGLLAFEIGYDQKEDINKIINKYYKNAKILNYKDLNEKDRVIIIKTE